ncbi:hypothetical protein LCGC14_1862560 [marine sediment metagenome]|uniref:Uncharacterized protein n=1 Tax=marine sediment metagenome TaxID=412755 RepID=A0A0F9G728_9ZZZZ
MTLSTFEQGIYGSNYRAVDGLDNLHYNMKERREAIKLYEELLAIPHANSRRLSAKWMSKANALYALLDKYFIPTVPPTGEESVAQIQEYVFGFKIDGIFNGRNNVQRPNRVRDPDWEIASKDFDDERWMTAWHATFAVMLLRRALKHDKLPMVCSAGWAQFAKVYCGLVMTA